MSGAEKKLLALAMAFHSRLGDASSMPQSAADVCASHISPLIRSSRSERISKIAANDHKWKMSWASSSWGHQCYSLSPNKRWMIMINSFSQQRSDRYESDIDDQAYILFDLEADEETFEVEVGRFYYYNNYNNYADCETTEGCKYEWEGGAILAFSDGRKLELEATTMTDIKSTLGNMYRKE
jgi:hypothetical protein